MFDGESFARNQSLVQNWNSLAALVVHTPCLSAASKMSKKGLTDVFELRPGKGVRAQWSSTSLVRRRALVQSSVKRISDMRAANYFYCHPRKLLPVRAGCTRPDLSMVRLSIMRFLLFNNSTHRAVYDAGPTQSRPIENNGPD